MHALDFVVVESAAIDLDSSGSLNTNSEEQPDKIDPDEDLPCTELGYILEPIQVLQLALETQLANSPADTQAAVAARKM